jgi:hypothetical protein
MKTLVRFLKVTLIGGLLVVLPVWVSLLLLLKAIKGAMAMLLPIAKLLPQWFVHEKIAALGLLLVICFVVGLLTRTRPGKRIGDWLGRHIFDRIPGFSLMRGMTRQLAGKKGNSRSNQPWWRSRTHWCRHSSSRNTQMDSSPYSSRPVRRRWRGLYIFCNPNACIRWMCLCARRWSGSPNGGLELPRCAPRCGLEASRRVENETCFEYLRRQYRKNPAQWPPAIISFMIWRPVNCNGPMPLPGRNHMPLSLSRQ